MEVGKWLPPIVVSFHLGYLSTSMMGERVNLTIFFRQTPKSPCNPCDQRGLPHLRRGFFLWETPGCCDFSRWMGLIIRLEQNTATIQTLSSFPGAPWYGTWLPGTIFWFNKMLQVYIIYKYKYTVYTYVQFHIPRRIIWANNSEVISSFDRSTSPGSESILPWLHQR